MRFLLTGGTGFVGGHLAARLASRGHEVVALARSREQFAGLERLGVRPAHGSLDDAVSLRAALEGCEAVLHVAGLTAGSSGELHRVNAAGTERLLAAARAAAPPPRRFLYVSSQAALGPSPPGRPLAEDAPCHPVTDYGRSKLAGERATMSGSLPWTIVRPPAVYGPADREFLQLFRVARTGFVPVFGDGTQELSLVFVTDLVEAIEMAVLSERAEGRIYHVAHRTPVSSGEVARQAAAALGRRARVVGIPGTLATPVVALAGAVARLAGARTVLSRDKMHEFLAPSWLLDCSRARDELGFEASTDLATGFRLTAAWYRENGWL